MKVSESIATCRSLCPLVLICCLQSLFAQTSFTGSWEGVFMGEFKAYVDFRRTATNVYGGNIRMQSGQNVIQDRRPHQPRSRHLNTGWIMSSQSPCF